MHRRICLAAVLALVVCTRAEGQIVVYDPAVTTRNGVTAGLKEYLVNLQRQQRQQLERMAQRLSLFSNLGKYSILDVPEWRIHVFFDAPEEPVLFARDYHAALNYGDASGSAYAGVSVPLVNAAAVLGEGVHLPALRDFAARLATVNVADATAIAGTHSAGLVRFNGRSELDAIARLEADVIDPSPAQGATAVLEKLSGAALIGARQRQARTQLLVGIVEQLLVDSKRTRDTKATLMNMQVSTWRHSRAANEAFVAGASEALRRWRQP